MITRKFILFCISLVTLIILAPAAFAQDEDEDYYTGLLTKEVEVENPVYKPVISLVTGIIHFLGDVKNPGFNPLSGEMAYKFNISTLFGNKNYYKLNFFFLYGNMQGHDFDFSRQMQSDVSKLKLDDNLLPIFYNSSFRTEFFEFGISVEYGFGHLFGKSKRFRPFFSVGVSPLQIGRFQSDLTNNNGDYYHFWDDGTIRNIAATDPNAFNANIIGFNRNYNADIAKNDFHELEKYSQTAVVVPIEFGFDFYLSYRINLRVATSLHYTFTDLLDNFNEKVAAKYNIPGNFKGNDMFMFTNFSLNFDLFSDPEMIKVDLLFAELEDVDYEVMFADQDMDGVFDRLDECPDTPVAVPVDSLGCPFDTDGDGISDFMDDEANTPLGAIVDERGVQVSADVLAQMFENPTAVRREDAQMIPVAPIWTRSITFTPGVIPEKFREVDKDGDGYVSFQELMKAIEAFFDGSLSMSVEDIYKLNSFFFSQ
ncbi:MAG: EF-hand domain-containing protein [Tenuifilaceae bacterium]|jgi:hypothetical protein|nr:EF-hand domain-containing protein [Tenuifilaceae bacterium]